MQALCCNGEVMAEVSKGTSDYMNHKAVMESFFGEKDSDLALFPHREIPYRRNTLKPNRLQIQRSIPRTPLQPALSALPFPRHKPPPYTRIPCRPSGTPRLYMNHKAVMESFFGEKDSDGLFGGQDVGKAFAAIADRAEAFWRSPTWLFSIQGDWTEATRVVTYRL